MSAPANSVKNRRKRYAACGDDVVDQNTPKTKIFYFVGGFAVTRWF
jgi:hypothetical protein